MALENVVFEVTEFKSNDLPGLIAGIEIFRAQGISFAIDDFGIDSSNEERVILLKPDFIKLDKSLLDNYIAHGDVTFIEAIEPSPK
ncbi:MAG: EAL domain-containing protein (putative c-di-GMP-specific phosphodiesterase class I) [Moritella dasanensis]